MNTGHICISLLVMIRAMIGWAFSAWISVSFMKFVAEFDGQVENAEKGEKVVKCEKLCLLNQNMGKKPL